MTGYMTAGMAFLAGGIVETCRLLLTDQGRRERFTKRTATIVGMFLYRCAVVAGLSQILAYGGGTEPVQWLSGKMLWLVLGVAIGLWYLLHLHGPLLDLVAQMIGNERWHRLNIAGYWLVIVTLIFLLGARVSQVYVIVVCIASIVSGVRNGVMEFSIIDGIGLVIGSIWLGVVEKEVREVAKGWEEL